MQFNYTEISKQALIADLLHDHFGDNKIVGVEIGVWRADTSVYLLNRFRNIELHGVDPYLVFDGELSDRTDDCIHLVAYETQAEADAIYRRALFRYRDFNGQAVLHRMESDKAVNEFVDNSLDFVYIDGNHHYESVKQDIELWLPKIKDTGLIIGYDFNWKKSVEDVARAVVETFGYNYSMLKNTWWITKADYLASL